jgi:transcriptional regulator with XRE-family HTH domain
MQTKAKTKLIDNELTKKAYLAMESLGWSQRYLAKRMGVWECDLSSLLSGRRHWTLSLLCKFKDATNLQGADLD